MDEKSIKVKRTVYELSDEMIKNHCLIMTKDDALPFYSWLRETFQVNEDCKIDVTKIRIAKNIEEQWIEDAKESGIDTATMNMTLLQYGPRVDESLDDNEICIYNGWLIDDNSENK